MHRTPFRGDDGQVGGIEAIPFGLLVFVAGSLLIANAWAVVDAKFATDAAAHQAARTFAESEAAGDAVERAVEAGLAAIDGHGRSRSNATITAAEGTTFRRCERVTFIATYRLPALTVPFLGGLGDGIDVSSRASEVVDPFRAGVPGEIEECA